MVMKFIIEANMNVLGFGGGIFINHIDLEDRDRVLTIELQRILIFQRVYSIQN